MEENYAVEWRPLIIPQRMLACQYCEFELPAVDLFEHQDVCGNRTEYCQPCRKYIRLREWIGHEIQFHANSNVAAESSRTMLEKNSVLLQQNSQYDLLQISVTGPCWKKKSMLQQQNSKYDRFMVHNASNCSSQSQ